MRRIVENILTGAVWEQKWSNQLYDRLKVYQGSDDIADGDTDTTVFRQETVSTQMFYILFK